MEFGLTPCPNDTYIFYKFIQKPWISPIFLDVEELNQLALQGNLPLVKVSCATAVQLKEYVILASGAAMGFGCGPLLVSNYDNSKNLTEKIKNSRILIPGKHTTANFLFANFCSKNQIPTKDLKIEYVRYDQIIPSLIEFKSKNQNAMGILIHEERFTYRNFNLNLEMELGSWWEMHTQLPIPLGCIVLHKDFWQDKVKIEEEIRESILYSKTHFQEVFPFIKNKAQTLSEEAILNHIHLYVNDFSLNIEERGWIALDKMKQFIQTL
ncbi:MAG: MqnA/MqnD/SBP family protein [Leptonema sp. (in: bacteria)]